MHAQAVNQADPAFAAFVAFLRGDVRAQTIAAYRLELEALERKASHLRVMLHALILQRAIEEGVTAQPPVLPFVSSYEYQPTAPYRKAAGSSW